MQPITEKLVAPGVGLKRCHAIHKGNATRGGDVAEHLPVWGARAFVRRLRPEPPDLGQPQHHHRDLPVRSL